MRFPGGRTKAVTFSYDDGVKADKKLISVLDKYGLKGTFNLNSACFGETYALWHDRMSEPECIALYKGGRHEVAMHGARHIFMTKVPLYEAVREVSNNRQYLEETYGRIVRGLAYAYGAYTDDIVSALKDMGVCYARTTEDSRSFDIPNDWLRLKPTCHHTDSSLNDLANEFVSRNPSAPGKMRDPLLFYVWGHSYEFDDNSNWYVFENLCKKLSGAEGVWAATNIEIYDYVKAYDSLIFSMDGERAYNPSCTDVYFELRGELKLVPAGGTTLMG